MPLKDQLGQDGLYDDLVFCEGGLDLTQATLPEQEGAAIQLVNYEPSTTGGYRRIDGYIQYSPTIVPGTGPILGVKIFNDKVIAARADTATTYKLYSGSGGAWTAISGALSLPKRLVTGWTYNLNGTPTVIFCDGTNPAQKWDGTTLTAINGTGTPSNPQFVHEFKGTIYLSGYSTNPGAFKFSVADNDTDFDPVHGAGEIVIGDEVTWIQSFRDTLYIFCRNSIHAETYNIFTGAQYLNPVTRKIGCADGYTVQEVGGDLMFLAPDGIRTIAGTNKIGDVELGALTRPILGLIKEIRANSAQPLTSLVVREKSQYRLFYSRTATSNSGTFGIIAGLRRFRDGHEGWEFGQLSGIAVSGADTAYLSTGAELVVHGGTDGFIYTHDTGTDFNGTPITFTFQCPWLDGGDSGFRKNIQRVTVYASVEGVVTVNLTLQYDYNSTNDIQPAPYVLTGLGGSGFSYDDGIAAYDDGLTIYDSPGVPLFRQNTDGSGFRYSVTFSGNTSQPSHSIEGLLFEYSVGGRN